MNGALKEEFHLLLGYVEKGVGEGFGAGQGRIVHPALEHDPIRVSAGSKIALHVGLDSVGAFLVALLVGHASGIGVYFISHRVVEDHPDFESVLVADPLKGKEAAVIKFVDGAPEVAVATAERIAAVGGKSPVEIEMVDLNPGRGGLSNEFAKEFIKIHIRHRGAGFVVAFSLAGNGIGSIDAEIAQRFDESELEPWTPGLHGNEIVNLLRNHQLELIGGQITDIPHHGMVGRDIIQPRTRHIEPMLQESLIINRSQLTRLISVHRNAAGGTAPADFDGDLQVFLMNQRGQCLTILWAILCGPPERGDIELDRISLFTNRRPVYGVCHVRQII